MIATVTHWVAGMMAAGILLCCASIGAKISRATRCAVRFGIFSIVAGILCFLGGGRWLSCDWIDVVILAGILLYLISNLRTPVSVPSEAWSNRLSAAVTVVVVILIGATFSAQARAQIPAPMPDPRICKDFARYARGVAQIRDLGADQKRFYAAVADWTVDSGAGTQRLLLDELLRIYKEKPTPLEAADQAYKRCMLGWSDS